MLCASCTAHVILSTNTVPPTGKNETELPEVRRGRPGSTYVDRFPFIWNKYEQSGYVTLFAEDQPGERPSFLQQLFISVFFLFV